MFPKIIASQIYRGIILTFSLYFQHLTEQGHLETLTEGVIRQHMALRGLSQASAEEYYILAAQHLNGYGQELFFAKVSYPRGRRNISIIFYVKEK